MAGKISVTNMALGKRRDEQVELFVPTAKIVQGPGHPFYAKLDEVLRQGGFDGFVEQLCAPFYKEGGRPSIPPGVYFRMLLIGYFEGIDSQRGIAWRCADSLALRNFLGIPVTESTPVHASMSVIRKRLAADVFQDVFLFVLNLLREHGLLRGKILGIDATTLEANAAMKSIVRKDGGERWKEYLRKLAAAEGMENPTDEDLRRLDRRRAGKKVSNQDWESPTDPDSRITKMKDGRTHLAYKAEHAVDLETEAIVAAEIKPANQGDTQSGPATMQAADENLLASGHEGSVQACVADKGYHGTELIAQLARRGMRTYIPERKQKVRRWTDKPEGHKTAFRNNRRRMGRARGRRLSPWRSERCERTFAHVCETGGARRAWVRGTEEVAKLYRLRCAAYNLGLLLRKVFGLIKPRGLAGGWAAFSNIFVILAAVASIGMGGMQGLMAVILVFGLLHLVVSRLIATARSSNVRLKAPLL
jgi:transposase